MKGINTRKKIIESATEIIGQKGYHNSNISDIAEKAGIRPSVIYKYFKDKEDLLCSLPIETSIQFINRFEKDLKGIEGSENLLRKLTWSLFEGYQENPNYSICLMMECRPQKNFYKSDGYKYIKNFSRMFTSIFKEGQARGEFNSDVNPALVRDLVLGALDYEVMSWVVSKEIERPLDDFQVLFKLFKNMTRPKPKPDTSKDNKKNLLLDAALNVFAKKNYEDATISEIAAMAGVADGIVYEYFKNKEDLLLSIADRQMKKDAETLKGIFKIIEPRRKLRRFVRYYCGVYSRNQNYLKVFLLLVQTNRRFYELSAYDSYKMQNKLIEEIIKDGQESGVFDPDITPRVFRNMLLGGTNHVFLRWFLVSKAGEPDKLLEIEEITNLLDAAVSI